MARGDESAWLWSVDIELHYIRASNFWGSFISENAQITSMPKWHHLSLTHLKEKKCCVSRAYAVCCVTPNFWENALTAEKKNCKFLQVILKHLIALKIILHEIKNITGELKNSNCGLYKDQQHVQTIKRL